MKRFTLFSPQRQRLMFRNINQNEKRGCMCVLKRAPRGCVPRGVAGWGVFGLGRARARCRHFCGLEASAKLEWVLTFCWYYTDFCFNAVPYGSHTNLTFGRGPPGGLRAPPPRTRCARRQALRASAPRALRAPPPQASEQMESSTDTSVLKVLNDFQPSV